MATIQMKQGTKSSYLAIAKKDADTLYFTIDTGEVFLGDLNMSQTNTCFVPEISVQEAQVNTLLDSLSSAKAGDVAVVNVYFQEFSNSATPTHYLCLGDTWAVVSCNLVKASTIKFANAISDTSKTLADIQAGKQDLTEVLSSIYSNVGEKISQQDGKIGTTELDLSSTKEKLDGVKNTAESALTATQTLQDTKFDKAGGTVDGSVSINGDLTVKGKTTTEEHETVLVRDNLVILNSEKVDLQTSKSGIVIYKNNETTYGIVYDPVDDTYKFGEGSVDTEGEFHFNENEGQPLAIRDDSSKMVHGHVIVWDAVGHKLVDGGLPVVVQPDWSQTDTAAADYIKNKPDVNAMTRYTNTEAMTIDVGGIKASDHKNGFIGVKIQDVLDELLYPEIPEAKPEVTIYYWVVGDYNLPEVFLAPAQSQAVVIGISQGDKKIVKAELYQKYEMYDEEYVIHSWENEFLLDESYYQLEAIINYTFNYGPNIFNLRVYFENGSIDLYLPTYRGVYADYIGLAEGIEDFESKGFVDEVKELYPESVSQVTVGNQLDLNLVALTQRPIKSVRDGNGLQQKWDYIGRVVYKNANYYMYVGPSADLTETFTIDATV